MVKFIAILAAGLTLFASPAFAQEDRTAVLEEACKADIQRFCPGIKRGEGAVLYCIAEHYGQLSNACRQALDGSGDDATLYDDAPPDGVKEREGR